MSKNPTTRHRATQRQKPDADSTRAAQSLRRDAFHEAAHVALDYLFGTDESLVLVEVNPAIDEESFMKGARVRNQGVNRLEMELAVALQRRNIPYARHVARGRIAQLMAGASATNRIAPRPDPDWYEEELESLQWEFVLSQPTPDGGKSWRGILGVCAVALI